MFTRTEILASIKRVAKEIREVKKELNPSCIVISNANYGIQLANAHSEYSSYLNILDLGNGEKGWNFCCDCFTTPIFTEEYANELAAYINSHDERKVVVVKPRLRRNLEALLEAQLDAVKCFGKALKLAK